jgi:hypothetical protein
MTLVVDHDDCSVDCYLIGRARNGTIFSGLARAVGFLDLLNEAETLPGLVPLLEW